MKLPAWLTKMKFQEPGPGIRLQTSRSAASVFGIWMMARLFLVLPQERMFTWQAVSATLMADASASKHFHFRADSSLGRRALAMFVDRFSRTFWTSPQSITTVRQSIRLLRGASMHVRRERRWSLPSPALISNLCPQQS